MAIISTKSNANAVGGGQCWLPDNKRPSAPLGNVPNPWGDGDALDAWDYVVLGSFALPGVCRVGVKVPKKRIDTVMQPAVAFASTRFMGYEPATVDIEMKLATYTQLQRWAGMYPILNPPAEKLKLGGGANQSASAVASAIALTIDHAKTKLYGIERVIIEDIDDPMPDPGGFVVITIKCLQYKAPIAIKTLTVPLNGQAIFPNGGGQASTTPTKPSAQKIKP